LDKLCEIMFVTICSKIRSPQHSVFCWIRSLSENFPWADRRWRCYRKKLHEGALSCT
jgi:hypothetical protein